MTNRLAAGNIVARVPMAYCTVAGLQHIRTGHFVGDIAVVVAAADQSRKNLFVAAATMCTDVAPSSETVLLLGIAVVFGRQVAGVWMVDSHCLDCKYSHNLVVESLTAGRMDAAVEHLGKCFVADYLLVNIGRLGRHRRVERSSMVPMVLV